MLSKTNAVVLCFGALIGGSVLAEHDPAKLSRMLKTDGPLPENRPKIAHVNMGNLERARDLAKRCLEANPGFPPEDYFRTDPYIDPAVPERMIADFRKAL